MIDLTLIETLVREFQGAAYDSGWYAGAIENGRTGLEEEQKRAIQQRQDAKKDLMLAIVQLCTKK